MSEANKYAPSQAALDTRDAAVPPEIDRWNWGAFLLSWIWGIGNNTFSAFLTFVPFVGIVMPFVLGAKGSAWAWRNKRWESVEDFKATQRKWAIAGLITIEVRGPQGEANLSFSAEGPNGSGTVYVKATKSLGQWQLQDAVLEDSNGGRRIDLVD